MDANNTLNHFLTRCARATDFELCDAIAGAVEEKYGYDHLTAPNHNAPLHERIPFLVWSGQGFSEAEGLARMLALPFDRNAWADAYETIGLPHIAESVRCLAARLPDPCEECEHVAEYLSEVTAELDAAEKVLFAASNDVTRSLALFVRRQIERFAGLTVRLDVDGGPQLKNIGCLESAHLWIVDFARKNDDRIPTFAELQAFTMHDGLKRAASADYSIPLTGRLSGRKPDDPLVILRRPVFGQCYCITVAGAVQPFTE
jgi:hypothetical protein